MKTVVIIGPDFSPSGRPPATRIRFLANHLREFDWEPIILTTDPKFYEWSVDPENDRLLATSVEVLRTQAFSAGWTRKVGIGDIGMRSLWHHWQTLKKLCRERKVDLIFIPVPPYVPMILGRFAQRKFSIPYVIDYIDPWVSEYYWNVPREQRPPKWPLAYAMARILEPYALKNVSHITGVSKGTTESVRSRYPSLSDVGATEIPYGAEIDDFAYVKLNARKNSVFDAQDGLFHISYVGACIPGMYPAVEALFRAVQLGLRNNRELFERVKLHFVGTSYGTNGNGGGVKSIAAGVGISSQVEEYPSRVPYLDSLQIMLDSAALILVGSDEQHYTASKVFPYILAQRPFLAIFHEDSSVIKIINDTNSGRFVTFNLHRSPAESVLEIARHLEALLSVDEKRLEHVPRELLQTYSTRAMAARLAGVFDRVLSESRN